jgi:hypothetical protein
MTKKRKGNLWLALLITALGLGAVSFAAAGIIRRPKTPELNPQSGQQSSNISRLTGKAYVRRSLLSPKLIWNLKALGNRLEKPGKERLTITGVLRRSVDSQPREIIAVQEFPDRLRLVIQNGPQSRVITFDGEQARGGVKSLEPVELDLIETLTYDTAEHFFATQMQGAAMRFLGARFRTDDGTSANYDGPYFDIYQVADQIKASGQARLAKLYYFNSDTLLLERVSYRAERDGSEIEVETRISDWREIEGQQAARRIERFENGKSIFVLTIGSAQLGSRADDRMFVQ